MSLLSEAMEKYFILKQIKMPDGTGGETVVWNEDAEISAAVVCDTSSVMKIAEKQGVTSAYTVTTAKDITLNFHDIIQRKSDGKTFRITSNGSDKYTPASAALNMRNVTAERWDIS